MVARGEIVAMSVATAIGQALVPDLVVFDPQRRAGHKRKRST